MQATLNAKPAYRSTYKTRTLFVPRFYGKSVSLDAASYVPTPSDKPAPYVSPYRGTRAPDYCKAAARAATAHARAIRSGRDEALQHAATLRLIAANYR